MITTNFTFKQTSFSDDSLNTSISDILNHNILCAIASIKNKESYIHTAYYCFNKKMNLFFISDPDTQHCDNIKNNSTVAVAIYDTNQPWDNPKRGLQLFGKCSVATDTKLIEGTFLYLKKFTGLKQWITRPEDFIKGAINSKLYIIEVESLKLFDEKTFGEEVFINLCINSEIK